MILEQVVNLREKLISWKNFYTEIFPEARIDIESLRVPSATQGLEWPIVMGQGITELQWVDRIRMSGDFEIETYNDLTSLKSDRTAVNSSYVVLARDPTKMDKEIRSEDGALVLAPHITLAEYLAFHHYHWWRTKEHMDDVSITRCAGTRDSAGAQPRVDWDEDRKILHIFYCGANDRMCGALSGREVLV